MGVGSGLYMYDVVESVHVRYLIFWWALVVLRSPAAPAHPHWSLQCDRYKSIDIEVSISISILLRQSIDIGIDDTFKDGIDIEYRRYFWKISITTLWTGS